MTAATGTSVVAPTDRGCTIRIEGHGTTRLSAGVESLSRQVLSRDDHAVVVMDLSACDYLDSTFLGLLMNLHRDYGKSGRVLVAAPPEVRKRLLGPSMIDRYVHAIDGTPPPKVRYMPLPNDHVDRTDLLRHIYQCHLALAEVKGPMQEVFRRIADEVGRELDAQLRATSA